MDQTAAEDEPFTPSRFDFSRFFHLSCNHLAELCRSAASRRIHQCDQAKCANHLAVRLDSSARWRDTLTSMKNVYTSKLPAGALLAKYAASGAYTDCYAATLPSQASLADFMAAFYTTPIFKLERWLLARVLRLPSTDQEAQLLSQDKISRFSAWSVEARQPDQIILAAGRTRSWLMVSGVPGSAGATTLFFGSAVVPLRNGGLGWPFDVLLLFHKLYSRLLLASAVWRLDKSGP